MLLVLIVSLHYQNTVRASKKSCEFDMRLTAMMPSVAWSTATENEPAFQVPAPWCPRAPAPSCPRAPVTSCPRPSLDVGKAPALPACPLGSRAHLRGHRSPAPPPCPRVPRSPVQPPHPWCPPALPARPLIPPCPRVLVPSYARALALSCPRAENAGDGQGESGEEDGHEVDEDDGDDDDVAGVGAGGVDDEDGASALPAFPLGSRAHLRVFRAPVQSPHPGCPPALPARPPYLQSFDGDGERARLSGPRALVPSRPRALVPP
jgi:hypothetical protein